MIVGSHLGVIETTYQPMKIAACRGAVDDLPAVLVLGCSRSAAAKTTRRPTKIIQIPHLLSLLATDSWNGQVAGPEPAAGAVPAAVRAGELRPERVHPVLVDAGDGLHWRWCCSRLRCGARGCSAGSRLDESAWFLWVAIWAAVLPFVMNTAGWLLTENGRQPWIVQGLQLTKDGVSPSVSRRGGDQPDRVRPALRRAGRRRRMLMLRYARRETRRAGGRGRRTGRASPPDATEARP